MTITELPTATTTTEDERTLVFLDPRELLAHPSNPRRKLRGIKELAASVKAVGIVQALSVRLTDDGYLITAGWRRANAAVDAGLTNVPCLVASVGSDDLADLSAMVAENVNREALTAGEEAAAYRQMALGGMDVRDIVKVSGRKRAEVEQGIEVGANEVAVAVASKYDVTMEQAAAIAEFSGDREAVKELTKLAVQSPGSFDHKLSRLRQDRERQEQREALVAQCAADGVTVVDDEGGSAERVRDLRDDKGKALVEEKHRRCPGHAVVIRSDWSGVHAVAFCTDPKANGHVTPSGSSSSGAMSDEQRAERREVVENNKAWRAAEPVRREFVARLCARKATPKGVLRFVVIHVLDHAGSLGSVDIDLLSSLLPPLTADGDDTGGITVPEGRLPLLLLAQVAASVEKAMGVHTWRNAWNDKEADFLAFLVTQGYEASEVEQIVIDRAVERAASRAPVSPVPDDDPSEADVVAPESEPDPFDGGEDGEDDPAVA